MTDLTVADVRAYLEACDRALVAEARAAAETGSRPGKWSATQIVDHLNRTEQVMYPMWALVPRLRAFPGLIRLADRANAALWRGMGMATVVPSDRLTPDNAASGSFRAPVFLAPSANCPGRLDELLERRRRIRGRTLRAVFATDEAVLISLRWSHPLLGSYTLLEFAQFLGVHEQHHLPQIMRLRKSTP